MVAVPRQHTHAGITYPAGTLVDLPEADVQWLVNAHKTTLEALVATLEPSIPQAAEIDVAEPASVKRNRFFGDDGE